MTTIAYPTSGLFVPQAWDWGMRANVFMSTSPYSGDVQTVEVPGARWLCSLTYAPKSDAHQAEIEAFWARVRGPVNRVALWHMKRPAPRGTLRGTPTLASAVAQFATTLPITAGAGETLLAGDMVGVGGQLHMVTADATAAAGVITAQVSPPVRAARASGAAVTWDRPTALFITTAPEYRAQHTAKVSPGMTVDLVEVFG